MTFTHPLARTAYVGLTAGSKGKVRRILVIITELQLDMNHEKYNDKQIKRLSDAARAWLEDNPSEAGDFMLLTGRRSGWATRIEKSSAGCGVYASPSAPSLGCDAGGVLRGRCHCSSQEQR